jgi:hypothetical protein
VHVHTAILDAVVIVGGAMMIFAVAPSLIQGIVKWACRNDRLSAGTGHDSAPPKWVSRKRVTMSPGKSV